MPIREGDSQAKFERRIFEHYCGSFLTKEGRDGPEADWEILALAMLLDHAPRLISDDEQAKRGRKPVWTDDRLARLMDAVDRIRTDESAPKARRTVLGAAVRRQMIWDILRSSGAEALVHLG